MPLAGPPPAQLEQKFKRIKLCVLAMIASTFAKLFVGLLVGAELQILLNSLNMILSTVSGIFLLRDDPLIGRIYAFLARTCCQMCTQQCAGGMSCLMNFVMVTAICILMDLIAGNFGVIWTGFTILFDPSSWPTGFGAFVFLISFPSMVVAEASQFLGCYFGYQAYKQAVTLGLGQSGGDWGGGAASAGTSFRSGDANQPSAPPAPSQFQAFAGGGQRLGS